MEACLHDNPGRRRCEVDKVGGRVSKEDKNVNEINYWVFMRGGKWYWLGRVHSDKCSKKVKENKH